MHRKKSMPKVSIAICKKNAQVQKMPGLPRLNSPCSFLYEEGIQSKKTKGPQIKVRPVKPLRLKYNYL
jgi:hypothetical protein